jgi:hypothetical protein
MEKFYTAGKISELADIDFFEKQRTTALPSFKDRTLKRD